MSFGKDPTHLNSMPGYGGSVHQRAANAGRKKQRDYGNKRPYWADTFKPSETAPADIRLIPGDFDTARVDEHNNLITEKTPWFEIVEHYSGTHRRGAICSGGPWFFNKDKRTPCLGCDKREAEARPGKGQRKSMSRSDKFAFITIDKGLFHQVQQVDRENGRARINSKTNEPYLEWVKCTGRGCQGCNVALQHKWGYIQAWLMNKAHFNSLNSLAANIGKCCVTCSGRSTIQAMYWLCGNQQCRQVIFDMATTTATDQQIGEVVSAPYACTHCRVTAYPEEIIHCTNCSPRGQQPLRASIFDVDLQVQVAKTGENDNTVLQVTGMSDPKPLDPHLVDLLQYKPDLKKRFAPPTLEEQAKVWPDAVQSSTPQMGMAQPGSYLPPQMPQQPQQYAQPYGHAPVQQQVPPQMPQHPPVPGQPMPFQQPQYQGMPQAPQYAAPAPQPQYAPPAPMMPQQPAYGHPPAPQYAQPPQPQYQQPVPQQQPFLQPPTFPQGGYYNSNGQ